MRTTPAVFGSDPQTRDVLARPRLGCMKIIDKIKSLFRARPRTEEELAARAEAEATRARAREQAAEINLREGPL